MGIYREGGRYGVTLEDLKGQLQSLNMRSLLAMQVHDDTAQLALEEEIKTLRRQINNFSEAKKPFSPR